MSFWLKNPTEILKDWSIIPDEKESYSKRMNTLTRLVIFLSILFYIIFNRSSNLNPLNLCIFGIMFIIILYYSKDMQSSQQFNTRESFAMGYHSQINNVNPTVYPIPDYLTIHPSPSQSSQSSQSSSSGFLRNPIRQGEFDNEGGFMKRVPYTSHSEQNNPHLNRQPLNRGYGLEPVSYTQTFQDNFAPHLDPLYVPSIKSQYQHGVFPPDNDDRTGNTRVTSILGGPSQEPDEEAYRNYELYGPRGGSYSKVYDGNYNINNYRSDETIVDRHQIPQLGSYGNQIPYNLHNTHNTHNTRDSRYTSPVEPQEYSSGDGYQNVNNLKGNNQYYTTDAEPFTGLFAVGGGETVYFDTVSGSNSVIPRYRRDGVTSEDYIDEIKNVQLADELFFRDNMIESAASLIARNDYQHRFGPVRTGRR